MTDVVNLLPLISLAADPDGQVWTGHTTIGDGQPSGTRWIIVTKRMPLLVSLLRQGSDSDVPRRSYEAAVPSGRSSPFKPDGRKGRARVFWRPNGR